VFKTRKRQMLTTFATCAVAGIAALAFATILGDSTGMAGGKIGQLSNVTFNAALAEGDGLLPGASNGTAAVSTTNPNSQSQYAVSVASGPGRFLEENGTNASPAENWLSVNAGPLTPAIEIPPGTTTIQIPAVFSLAADAPLASFQNARFRKDITLRLASTPSG
jgi:hypothetical protein